MSEISLSTSKRFYYQHFPLTLRGFSLHYTGFYFLYIDNIKMRYRKKVAPDFPFLKKEKPYVLVISGGGTRGFYGLGILKAFEELGYREKIDAIYGVSVGGLLASYWAAGYTTDVILERFLHSDFLSLPKNLNLFPKHSLLKNTLIKKQIEKDLPATFEELKLPIFIGCTEVGKGETLMISEGDLVSAILGSIAIPGIFPAVKRGSDLLIDGGTTNNFPVSLAKMKFPNHKIIGISLNKYRPNPKIKNLFDNLMVSFEIMLRKDIEQQGSLADIFFCKNLNRPVLEFNPQKLKQLFLHGYHDALHQLKEK